MSFAVTGFKVLISSPSDVLVNRKLIIESIATWNMMNSERYGVFFQPVMWEYHTRPSYGSRPQSTINDQLLVDADFAVAVFGMRMGTPTGGYRSGTVEEIERMHGEGKNVLVYFYNGGFSLTPEGIESAKAVLEFKQSIQDQCLWCEFSSDNELNDHLLRHLTSFAEQHKTDNHFIVTKSDESPDTEELLNVLPTWRHISPFQARLMNAGNRMNQTYITVGVQCSAEITPFESEQKIAAQELGRELYLNSVEYQTGDEEHTNSSATFANIEFDRPANSAVFWLSVNSDGILVAQKIMNTGESETLDLKYIWDEYIKMYEALTSWILRYVPFSNIVGVGIYVGNWPKNGLDTKSLFDCIPPERFAGGSGHREVEEDSDAVDHKELFKTFVYNALNNNGYLKFEEGVRNLKL